MLSLSEYIAGNLGFGPKPYLAYSNPNPQVKIVYKKRDRVKSGAGTRITSGMLTDIDFNADIRDQKWYGERGEIGIAGRMMRDPHVRQSINYVTAPLRAATWYFKPASKDDLDREIADFCNYAFLECLPWDQILNQIVAGYCVNGFSLNEITDDNKEISQSRFPNHPGRGVGILPTGVYEIPANTVDRWYQQKGNPTKCAGIRQYIQGSDEEKSGSIDISSDNFLRFSFEQLGAYFPGLPVLRGAYPPWKLKMAFQTINAIRHERLGLGTPVITAGPEATDEDLDAAETILAEMRAHAKSYIVLPNGYVFQWVSSSTSDGTNIENAIEQCNRDIAYNVSAGFMLLGLQGKTGSYALGTTQQGQYHLSEESHSRFTCDVWNLGADGWNPTDRIVKLNYGNVAVPKLAVRNLPTHNYTDTIPMLLNAINCGAVVADDMLEEEIRDALDFGPPDITTARKRVSFQPEENQKLKKEEPNDDSDESVDEEPIE